MSIDRRIGSKISKPMRREETAARRLEPFPYVGIVKNNLDPTMCGRLQVWIPDLGGDPNEPKNWRTVSYASPFMGTTNLPSTASSTNTFTNVPHTYGMWMVPPDIGVEVIVIFVGGEATRGYWIACVNSNISRHMMPGLAGSTNIDSSGASTDWKKAALSGVPYPVAEFNETDPNLAQSANFKNNPKPVHEPQAAILRKQGLDRDDVRGIISSSSQRESPSHVFGISTPGRAINDPADDPEFANRVAQGSVTQDDYAVRTRMGGHTFVMDDGSTQGKDQLVRLRTAKGHQIMMHDTANTFYISNADGTVWIEMNESGRLDIFSAGGFNVRTQGTMNFHADGDINMNTGGKFNVRAVGKMQLNAQSLDVLADGKIVLAAGQSLGINAASGFFVESQLGISLDAKTKVITNGTILDNSAAGVPVKPPTPIRLNSLADSTFDEQDAPAAGKTVKVTVPGKLTSQQQADVTRWTKYRDMNVKLLAQEKLMKGTDNTVDGTLYKANITQANNEIAKIMAGVKSTSKTVKASDPKPGTGLWVTKSGALATIVTVAPSHEPFYTRPKPGTIGFFDQIQKSAAAAATPEEPTNGKGTEPPATFSGGAGGFDATKNVGSAGSSGNVRNPASEKDLREQASKHPVTGSIGPLNGDQLTALFAQMGKSESNETYNITKGQYNGKYMIGIAALKDLGYIGSHVETAEQLKIESNWIKGGDKPGSQQAFLNSEKIQEKAMFEMTTLNYKYMSANGAISKDTSPEEVAGLLSTAHLLGAGGANKWRKTGDGADANGTTGGDYFQRGKYAYTVLAPKVALLDASPSTIAAATTATPKS